MKRDIYTSLLDWKGSERRKPLLLQGARQTGKTFILKQFGSNEYDDFVYLNFEEDPGLDHFFRRDLNPKRILADLSIYAGRKIRPGADLVIFDEIQVSGRALNGLKYFEEQAKAFHVAAAGSLLGVKLAGTGSFPVGKVSFLHLYPMIFLEFLDSMGESRYRRLLEQTDGFVPFAEPFHRDLIRLLTQYYVVGGMPEAVRCFADKGDVREAREIQNEIINSYVLDFAKHAPAADIPKLTQVWESIPKHLGRENKKFVFSAVKKGARAREYENALTWLEDTGLIYRAMAVNTGKHPLKHYADANCFKVYAVDVGLLGAMARSPTDLIVQGERLHNEYEGAFVENFVAQELVTQLGTPLHYWRSKGGKAELDFLVEVGDSVYPLEVKAGINPRSKSLKSYDLQFTPRRLARANLLNLKKDGKTCNVPLYAISLLPRLMPL
jgi:predicted AAA+ superfamily ATPase